MAHQTISKYQGGMSLDEYREKRRTTRRSHEDKIKAELRARDGKGCRWPGCEFWKKGVRVEGVHLVDKGMGGDPLGIRTQRALMIRLCHRHHQGSTSIHSGDLDIVFLTSKGTDGPVQFLRRNLKAKSGWAIEGVENDFDVAQRSKRARDEHADEEGGAE
jgi:hypothetical protein